MLHKSIFYWIVRLGFISRRRYRVVHEIKPRRVLGYDGLSQVNATVCDSFSVP
jgi:hypothetical protein